MAGAMALRAAFLLQPTVRKPSTAPSSVPSCLPAFPSKKFPRGSGDGDICRSFGYFCLLMRRSRVVMKAGDSETGAGAVVLEGKPEAPHSRKLSPLKKGGTLTGDKAEGKNLSAAALGAESSSSNINGKFEDSRWKNGTWDLGQFTKEAKVDWDAVIDAEAYRRKWLENNPEASSNDEPVSFDTSIVPWWAWVKRYHLPEAERLNGRAAMIGFLMTYVVDSLTGIGLVDQMGSFVCKLLLFVVVVGVLLIRENEDLMTLKQIVKESTFYDKQWQATWQDEASEGPGKE